MHRRSFVRMMLAGAVAGHLPRLQAAGRAPAREFTTGDDPSYIKDYLYRMREPDRHYDNDVRAEGRHRRLLRSLNARLTRAQKVIGYANFNVIGLDEILLYGRRYSQIGRFGKAETDMLEQLFYEDASEYGFLGRKPLENLTEKIDRRDIVKIPRSGHYLFRGKPQQNYLEIRKELGEEVILTSGIRGIVKQMHLFLAKATRHRGNLSLASRSLAPPGYSFHGVGDFDVGVAGWGERNFTEEFATTEVFKRLIDLGYVDIRYPLDNRLGVRFEPWHIRVG